MINAVDASFWADGVQDETSSRTGHSRTCLALHIELDLHVFHILRCLWAVLLGQALDHWSRNRPSIQHVELSEHVDAVLALREGQSALGTITSDVNTQEPLGWPQVP
jgi:hypothetical protein